jgi:uncharacterized Zn finger protein (UPF0148 family)
MIDDRFNRDNLYEKQKKSRVCIKCKHPSLPGHVFCEIHLREHNDRSNKYRGKKAFLGLCFYYGCNEPAIPHRRYCEKHTNQKAVKAEELYNKRVGENKCPRCGTPLHSDMDQGYICCLNCREHIGEIPNPSRILTRLTSR